MKCPVCTDTTLLMGQRQDLEIDYCPQCRGIWLDRGELDRLLERPGGAAHVSQQAMQQHRPGHERSYRKSWLADLLD